MKTNPIRSARIQWGTDPETPPCAPDFGDVYHSRVGALAQARHVFVQGTGLPQGWERREDFVVLECGFGFGHNFLATWDAWRQDPDRCRHLHYVAIDRHPPTAQDLARLHAHSALPQLAAALQAQWPAPTANLHPLSFEDGRLNLLLAWGEARDLLSQLTLRADAVYLDGFAPSRNPEMWSLPLLKAVGRLCAVGAPLATWSVARAVSEGLVSAGFEVQRQAGIGGKRWVTRAAYRPRPTVRTGAQGPIEDQRLSGTDGPARLAPLARLSGLEPASTSVVVVGAGLAGAAVARALARRGVQVTVLESGAAPALGASGNPGGLFHATAHATDGPHARLFRAAALQAARDHAEMLNTGAVAGQVAGLLRLAPDDRPVSDLQAVLDGLGLPASVVQAVDMAAARAQSGVDLPGPAWLFSGGGWIAPGDWVRQALRSPGVDLRPHSPVARLSRGSDGAWCLWSDSGQSLARAPTVVLATAQGTAGLLTASGLGPPDWPLSTSRGQVSWFDAPEQPLHRPVAGDGYTLALPDGRWLCGATRQMQDAEACVRLDDHVQNLERMQRLTGVQAPLATSCGGRVGWRLHTRDGLPIAGPLPRLPLPQRDCAHALRRIERESGLFVCTALGARGLTLAPLLAQLVAAQILLAPWPLERDLAEAVDPARWWLRRLRHPGAQATESAAPAPSAR